MFLAAVQWKDNWSSSRLRKDNSRPKHEKMMLILLMNDDCIFSFLIGWKFQVSQIEFWRMWLEIHSIASLFVLDVWWKHVNWTCDFYVTTMLYWDLRLMGLVANRIWISVELPSSAQTGSPLGLKPYGQSPCNMFVNSQWKVLVLIIFPSSYGQALSIIWVVVNTPLVQSFSVHMSSSLSEFLVFNFYSQPPKKKNGVPTTWRHPRQKPKISCQSVYWLYLWWLWLWGPYEGLKELDER